jgi:homoaconitase/3-isopropylmalate dehydratase large subunit
MTWRAAGFHPTSHSCSICLCQLGSPGGGTRGADRIVSIENRNSFIGRSGTVFSPSHTKPLAESQ